MTSSDNIAKAPRGPEPVNGRLILQAFRHHPWLFAGVLLLAPLAGLAVWYFVPLPRYTGSVVFNVASQPPVVLSPTAEARADFQTYRQTQAALVKTRQVLNDTLQRPQVSALSIVSERSNPLEWLDTHLVVDFKSGTELMRVSLEADDPDEACTLLAGLALSYLKATDERENGARRERIKRLDEVEKEHQALLDRFQNSIDTIAVRLGSKDGATLAVVNQLTREELAQANRELNEIDAQLQAAAPAPRTGGPKPPAKVPASLVDDELQRDPQIVQLQADVARARARVTEIERLLKPDAVTPVLTRARDDVKSAEDGLARAKAELRPKIEDRLREKRAAEAELRQSQAAESAEQLKRRHNALANRIEEIKTKIGENNRFRINLENLKSQIVHTDKLTTAIGEERDRLKLELGAPPRVTLAEMPYTVSGILGNKRLKVTLMSVFGVCLLGWGGLVGWEYRMRRVTTARDLSNGLGLKLLGTVPPIDANGRRSRGPDPLVALAEAVDTTRTLLQYGCLSDKPLRTVLVTSAVQGEGKTSLAGHLAISLARAGYSTLLVDGDVRAPSAHALFGLPAAPGLCEALCAEADVGSVIHPTAVPGLSVLPAGRWGLAVRQSLVGARWSVLRSELESAFDFVVVDSGPVLAVSDSLLLAREVDGVLLTALLDVSRVVPVEESRDRLRAVGANVLGVVVNGVATPTYWSGSARTPVASADSIETASLPV